MQPPSLGRFGVLGDIHGEDVFLERALNHFAERGLDKVLAVGDLVDGLGDVNRTLDLLQEHGVVAVRGNHERWLLHGDMRTLPNANMLDELSAGSRRYIESLPQQLRFDTPRGALLLCHGLGRDDMAEVLPEDFGYALKVNDSLQKLIADDSIQLVVNGHSHKPMIRSFTEGSAHVTIINAGTLYREHEPRIVEVDLTRGEVCFVPFVDGALGPTEVQALP